jgi:pilus assembly protein CpaE
VIIDTFPILDSVLMTILDVADLDFVVVQGMAPAVAAIARFLPVLEGLGVPQSRQRLVLNTNYKPFLGNLQPVDIADRLQRTLDYVVPYERRVLTSMNTGSPHILHSRRWERFGRSINTIVGELDSWNVGGGQVQPQLTEADAHGRAPMERPVKVAEQEEVL